MKSVSTDFFIFWTTMIMCISKCEYQLLTLIIIKFGHKELIGKVN